MKESVILHVLRNSYAVPPETIREAKLEACNLIEIQQKRIAELELNECPEKKQDIALLSCDLAKSLQQEIDRLKEENEKLKFKVVRRNKEVIDLQPYKDAMVLVEESWHGISKGLDGWGVDIEGRGYCEGKTLMEAIGSVNC